MDKKIEKVKRIQTRKCLAEKYEVDPRTITRWITFAGLGTNIRRSLTPLELQIFINKIGTPDQLKQAALDLKNSD